MSATASIRRFVRRAIRRGLLFAGRFIPPESVWERVAVRVPATAFGLGSRRRFTHYFEGTSSVRLNSIDDIVDWLLGCEYVADTELFNEPDFWQHPGAFEVTRRGDCEDFALWTWRRLTEIGIDAEFYVGRVLWNDGADVDRRHAWVVYRIGDAAYLFEPAARRRPQMIRRLEEVQAKYVPHFAVDRRLQTYAFGGFLTDSRGKRAIGSEQTGQALEPSSLPHL